MPLKCLFHIIRNDIGIDICIANSVKKDKFYLVPNHLLIVLSVLYDSICIDRVVLESRETKHIKCMYDLMKLVLCDVTPIV